jgi:hypothetical protein
LNPNNFGFTRNNNYISNAEAPGIRNNKEMQRIRAGLSRPDVLNFMTKRVLQGTNLKEKPQGAIATKNALAILGRNNINSSPATQFEALYSSFLATHGGAAGKAMQNAITFRRNTAMNNNSKSYYNGLLGRMRAVV